MIAPDVHGETVKALLSVNSSAKRCQHIVGTKDYPSEWDGWHSTLDDLLADLGL